MDAMFNNGNHNRLNNNGHTIVTPEDNDVFVDVVNDDDQSPINKRKLANTTIINPEQQYQNGNDNAKRLCARNGHH
jgi:hypothetical protein